MNRKKTILRDIRNASTLRLMSGLIVIFIGVSIMRDLGVPWDHMGIMLVGAIVLAIPLSIHLGLKIRGKK